MQIKRLTSLEDPLFQQAVQVLTEAFRHDEPIRALTGWKDEALEASYLSSMTTSVQDNEVWLAVEPSVAEVDEERVLGVMTVKPPGRGKGPSPNSLGPQYDAYQALLSEEHKQYNKDVLEPEMGKLYDEAYAPKGLENMYYVALLGVSPAAQGKGTGGALVRHLMGRAKEAGTEAAVSTHNEKNRAYYEKLGFQVLRSGLFDVYGYDKRIPFWCLQVPVDKA